MKLTKLVVKRIEKGATQQDVADILNIERPHISRIETYKILPTPEALQKLLAFYECAVDDLYPTDFLKSICRVYRPKNTVADEPAKYYNFGARLRVDTISPLFTIENLRKLGYKDKTAWLYAKIKEFETELQNLD